MGPSYALPGRPRYNQQEVNFCTPILANTSVPIDIRETRANDEDGMNFDDRLILRAVAEFERLGGATP